MSTSLSEEKRAGKARETTRDQERDKAQVDVGHVIVTRSRSQREVETAGSSDKENMIIARAAAAAAAFPLAKSTKTIIPLLQPVEDLMSRDRGSPSKRKDPLSRPLLSIKSAFIKISKVLAQVDRRERLMLLNPSVKFFISYYLSALGRSILILLRNLWVDYIASDDERIIS